MRVVVKARDTEGNAPLGCSTGYMGWAGCAVSALPHTPCCKGGIASLGALLCAASGRGSYWQAPSLALEGRRQQGGQGTQHRPQALGGAPCDEQDGACLVSVHYQLDMQQQQPCKGEVSLVRAAELHALQSCTWALKGQGSCCG